MSISSVGSTPSLQPAATLPPQAQASNAQSNDGKTPAVGSGTPDGSSVPKSTSSTSTGAVDKLA